jgi:hypothetical protein
VVPDVFCLTYILATLLRYVIQIKTFRLFLFFIIDSEFVSLHNCPHLSVWVYFLYIFLGKVLRTQLEKGWEKSQMHIIHFPFMMGIYLLSTHLSLRGLVEVCLPTDFLLHTRSFFALPSF